MNKAIYIDMDGTIASLYGVQGWLDMLIAEDPHPLRYCRTACKYEQFGEVTPQSTAQWIPHRHYQLVEQERFRAI